MSGVGAITGPPMGILLRQLETRQMLEQVATEIYQISSAYNNILAKRYRKAKTYNIIIPYLRFHNLASARYYD